ncbi:TonB-linked outer membrane protein, SusC/RagA family [Arenibacter nanhaiticus]|uniref:TonB-linked outer membrane protein, SusC/RagA family n=1 Tax=Arenibacter nanhaiticus TaxID=558155 RepID=A0A1M6FTD9_9FLAO|nr:TonB-dependent receptor [Arenibacter nanhaiticus]SHJ00952.1 TonB-linked outer membrane protein, SusC/RagA family [Arenibacter nanhaiticus]
MKQYLFLLLTMGLFSSVMAQTTLSGTVVSKTDGMPIPGASIIPNNRTQDGVATDFDGNFTLTVAATDGVLLVSSMGYAATELAYSGSQNFTIALEDQSTGLDEVVLIGYGTSVKKNITSAIATVSNVASMASRPVGTLNDFLQGNVAGVTVLQQGGDPSETGKIVIRGLGSISNENPLMVVDGVPYYGPSINPNDIASVSILKDASAAAIYGAQAASGVIVIQTKKGKQGKPKIGLDMYSGMQSATDLPTPLNAIEQANVYNMAADNGGTPRQSAHDAAQNPWGQTTRTQWMDAIFRTALLYNANINVSGAGEHSNYMSSFGYNKKEGVLQGTGSERYSFRLKSEIDLSDRLTLGENVYFSHTESVGTNTSSGYSGTILNAIYMPSAAPIYDDQGAFHGVAPYNLSQFAGAYGDVYNPMSLLLRPTTTSPTRFMNANVFLDYKILNGLKFKTSYAYSTSQNNYKSFDPRRPELGRTNLVNSLTQSYATTNRWVWDNQLTYNKAFGDHNLDLTAVYSAQFTDYEFYSQRGEGFGNENKNNQYMSNAADIKNPVTDVYEDALTSAIGRAMYNYDNKYFLSASIRRDETSRLATANQADYFPSASMGWRISDETFFKIPAVNDLKFRASWGQIGNINSVGYYSFDVPLSTQTVIIGENGLENDKGVYAGKQSNPNLTWETSESINLGLDASLLNNRLNVTFDYFEKKTKGMILPGLEDKHQGTAAADVNGGEVKNHGLELSAIFNNSVGDLNYSLGANASMINNELVNLEGYNKSGIDFIAHSGENVRSTLEPFRSEVGRELYSNYLVPYLGIFQSQEEIDAYVLGGDPIQPEAQPGDFKFKDSNNDGKIDNNDKVFMGSYQPDLTFNVNLKLDYKRFDLGLIFQGVSGVKAFNGYKYSAYNAALQGYNLDNKVLGSWTPTNTNTNLPRLSTKDNNKNFETTSSWYLEDASYLRLKNITLGYSVSDSLMDSMMKGASLRVYISGENLFTFTDYSGLDPEVGGNGLDVGKYPLSRMFTAGLSLKL